MAELAIVGSQDVDASEWLDNAREVQLPTRDSSVKATVGTLNGYELIVMPRNSSGRPVPPHAIDYRANMDALSRAGVRMVLTTAMVGTLRHSVPNGSMLVLDQFIDFTKDRQFTFFSDDRFGFADMTEPYCPNLRAHMIRAGESLGLHMAPRGCCVCVPGPRFETRAEVRMFAQLGGDVIGHTNGTDCIMAREAGMCFATFAERDHARRGSVGPRHERARLARTAQAACRPVQADRGRDDPVAARQRLRCPCALPLRHGRANREVAGIRPIGQGESQGLE